MWRAAGAGTSVVGQSCVDGSRCRRRDLAGAGPDAGQVTVGAAVGPAVPARAARRNRRARRVPAETDRTEASVYVIHTAHTNIRGGGK